MLRQDIELGIKEALKSGDQIRLSTLRFLLAAVQNEEIAKQREAADEDVIAVVQKQVKQHKESIEAYEKGGRRELAQKEKNELEILNKFLPQQMSEEEIKKIVDEARVSLSEGDKNNFGKVMGMVMAMVKGKADGNLVSKVVKELVQ